MSDDSPPAGIVEISLFGRGYGESVLVHVGDGRWIIVDSLKDSDGSVSALSYLKRINVDPRVAVELLVSTHWHDDHIAGLSEIYQTAENSRLALPIAFKHDEFAAFVEAAANLGTRHLSSGVKEIMQISNIRRTRAIKMVSCNKRLLSIPGADLSHGLSVEIEALSPSDADVKRFLTQVGSGFRFTTQCRADPISPNDASIALWVRIGNLKLLLGGDLEIGASEDTGWNAVLLGDIQPDGQADVFKIPHHGSENGASDEVWSRYVSDDNISILTTWNRGKKLPTALGVSKILGKSQNCHITSPLGRRYSSNLNPVNRRLKDAGIRIRTIPELAGQIQIRIDPSNPKICEIKHFNGATTLENFVKSEFNSKY